MTEDQVAAARAKSFPYPGIPTTCDGADAVVHVEINVTQGAGAFPITSSTTMGGGYNAAVMNGWKNLWGDLLLFVEPESEQMHFDIDIRVRRIVPAEPL